MPLCRLCLWSWWGFLADYVPALEAEIQNLKHKFKTLEEQLEEPSRVSSSNADIQPRVSTSAGATGASPCPVVARTLSVFFLNCNANPQKVRCGDHADIGPRHQHPEAAGEGADPHPAVQFPFSRNRIPCCNFCALLLLHDVW